MWFGIGIERPKQKDKTFIYIFYGKTHWYDVFIQVMLKEQKV